MFNRKLAYVSYIHIYLEQDNHLENLTSLKILLFLVNMNKESVKRMSLIFAFLSGHINVTQTTHLFEPQSFSKRL